MMKMQAKLLAVCGVVTISGVCLGQGYMAESQAAINMQGTINNQMPGAPGVGGPPPVPGQIPGVGNPGAGFNPGQPGGNTMPGGGFPGAPNAGAGNANMDPTMGDTSIVGQQTAAVAAPAPIETANVLVGRRVYDAVSGGMLEDATSISVRMSDLDQFPDDGVNDNGIAGDGNRGRVTSSRNEYIGQFSNTVKNYLIHAIENAEQIDPMVYYGYHVAKIDPTAVEGLKRYGLPLPGEQEALAVPHVEPDFPSILDLEHDRDELVRQWNFEFLAKYRVAQNDPQSEYFPVFIPSPPYTPANYPVPAGYVAPQTVKQASATAIATNVAVGYAAQQAFAGGPDPLSTQVLPPTQNNNVGVNGI